MADPNGFQKIRHRQLPPERPVSERLGDWQDVHESPANQPWLAAQASRCMDCGVPFCHFGCPLGNLIPEWNDLVWRGQLDDAIVRMHATNNFPEFTGRVCPALCESACVLSLIEPAVTIRNIELAIADAEFAKPLEPQVPTKLTGYTVAVVGSGPAGLACAQQLTRAGHTVVVYERADAIGGLLRYGIPDFKLEKHLIDRRVGQMEAEGTRFRTDTEIGVDISWSDLRRRFDAVVCAIGASVPIDLPLRGRELSGVHFAMDYLTPANRDVAGLLNLTDVPHAAGKRVVIIGGGDTGSDCLGTALRQGAESVTTLQVLDAPPEERPAHQPWPTMPMVLKVSSSQAEGGTLEYLANAVEFIDDGSGAVRGVRVAQTEFGPNGELGSAVGTEREIPADLVLLSIGFRGPEADLLSEQLEIDLTDRGLVPRDAAFAGPVPGFFVCGDAGRGQSLVVWAIAEGRACAAAVDAFLQGQSELASAITAESTPLHL